MVIEPARMVMVMWIADRDHDRCVRTVPVVVIPGRIRIRPWIVRTECCRWRSEVVVDHYVLFARCRVSIGQCIGNNWLRLMNDTRLFNDDGVFGLANNDLLLDRASVSPMIAISSELGIASGKKNCGR